MTATRTRARAHHERGTPVLDHGGPVEALPHGETRAIVDGGLDEGAGLGK